MTTAILLLIAAITIMLSLAYYVNSEIDKHFEGETEE